MCEYVFFSLSFRGSLNLAILYLQEKGELKRLENKWWYDRGQCDQGMSVSVHYWFINWFDATNLLIKENIWWIAVFACTACTI